MKPILELKNVTKRYIGFTLDRVSFALEPGYIMALSVQTAPENHND